MTTPRPVPSRRLARATAAAAALGFIAAVPAAQAASVEIQNVAQSAETAKVKVAFVTGSTVAITRVTPSDETSDILVATNRALSAFGSGCTNTTPTQVRCSGGGRRLVTVAVAPDSATGGDPNPTSITVGPGIDPGTILGGNGPDTIDLSAADGTAFELVNGVLTDVGGPGARLHGWLAQGGRGDDVITPPAGGGLLNPSSPEEQANDQVIEGGDGDDVLQPPALSMGSAGDRVKGVYRGGAGNDTLDFSRLSTGVRVFLGRGAVEFNDIEALNGTNASDVLVGGPGPDEIRGNRGNDTVSGGGGDDLVLGGPGRDQIEGGDGNDRLGGNAEADRTPSPIPPREFQFGSKTFPNTNADDRDSFDGGPGADFIKAQGDGVQDATVICGDNGTRQGTGFINGRPVTFTFAAGDEALLDLVDTARSDCESVTRSDKNERGAIAARVLSTKGRSARVKLTCPKHSLVRCRGLVALVTGARGTTLKSGTKYSIAKGRSRTLTLRLRPGAKGTVRLRAVEQGRKAPRTLDIALTR